ncbi:hypothetical protein A3Q56_04653 [Intoshia linei]|uniref:Uncharacterized protein n=1 Tax=Intoshia linei TaxID=1819745 RepID=A0A177B030_9BILA|nr:hypothetical protein A3Q56_04653 [Intoshia linei]
MVKNFTFITVQDKINLINILQEEDLITLIKQEKYKIKMKAQNFTVKDGELFFLKGDKIRVKHDFDTKVKTRKRPFDFSFSNEIFTVVQKKCNNYVIE